MRIRTLIVDDEVLSRRGVEIRLRDQSDFEIVAQCANGREALAAVQQYKPDLMFLDIQMPDAAGDYMCIHAGGDTHILRGTMKELEEILDPKLFQRVHRSTIVNLRLVRSLRAHMNGEYFLTLEGGHELKLSRTYRDKVEYFLSGSR